MTIFWTSAGLLLLTLVVWRLRRAAALVHTILDEEITLQASPVTQSRYRSHPPVDVLIGQMSRPARRAS